MEGGERRQTAVKTWGFRETEREADDVRTEGKREPNGAHRRRPRPPRESESSVQLMAGGRRSVKRERDCAEAPSNFRMWRWWKRRRTTAEELLWREGKEREKL